VAWMKVTRRKYRRDGLRYASDSTDAEWAVIEPFMPSPAKCGRPRRIIDRNRSGRMSFATVAYACVRGTVSSFFVPGYKESAASAPARTVPRQPEGLAKRSGDG
jgi:transposase